MELRLIEISRAELNPNVAVEIFPIACMEFVTAQPERLADLRRYAFQKRYPRTFRLVCSSERLLPHLKAEELPTMPSAAAFERLGLFEIINYEEAVERRTILGDGHAA